MDEYQVVTVHNILDRDIEAGEYTWGGDPILKKTLKAGGSVELARFLADHLSKKISDEYIRENKGWKAFRNEELRAEVLSRIITSGEEEEELPETMPELKKMAKELGVKQSVKDTKDELIEKINNAREE